MAKKTYEEWLEAVKEDGWALNFAPEKLREKIKKTAGIKL